MIFKPGRNPRAAADRATIDPVERFRDLAAAFAAVFL